uniref:Uncharacterized protein n=1 Tax=Anguilla anguilla TaxID=7936 RepID=A0A0E9SW40_ANGAN
MNMNRRSQSSAQEPIYILFSLRFCHIFMNSSLL